MPFSVPASAIRLLLSVADGQAKEKLGEFGNAIGSLAEMARAAALQAAELSRRADQLGTSAGALDRFTRSARALAGVPFDRSIEALETFQEKVGRAAFEPDSEIANLFDRIGVAVRGTDGTVRDTLNVWQDFVEVIGKADRSTRNLLTAEFGDAVRDIAIPLSRNVEAVNEYEAALRKLAAIDDGLVADAAEANTSFELLGDTFDALTTNVGNFAAKYVRPLAEFAATQVGGLNNALFGSALSIEFDDLERARSYLAGIERLLDKTNASIKKIDDKYPQGGYGSIIAERRNNFLYARELLEARQAYAKNYIAAREAAPPDTDTVDNQPVADLTRHLEQQRETKDVETDRLALQLKLVGLSADEAQLATLRHQLTGAASDEERQRLQTRIASVEQLQAAVAAEQERVALETAMESLTLEIERAHYGIEETLLEEMNITRQMLTDSAALRALFDDVLAKRREAAAVARDEKVFGQVDRTLAEEQARAAGVDVRMHRILVDLQRQGIAYTQQDLDLLEEKLQRRDELAFANDLRDDLRGAVGDGLREGLHDFAEGGDIGDVFDSIGRRLSSLLLDLAIGQFGQGGAGGTGLLGWLGGLFGGRREHGGPVDAGRLYLIGERGPELFMPRTAGTVLASMDAGPPITQNITVRGTVRSDADVAAIAHRVAQQSVAGLVGAIRNGRVAA